jgi:hypothetical protein
MIFSNLEIDMRLRTILASALPLLLAACATPPVVLENGSSPKVDLTLCYKWGDVRKDGPDNTQSYFLGPDGSPVFAAMANVTAQSVPAFCDVLADFNAGTVISPRTRRLLLTVTGGASSMTFGDVALTLYRSLSPGTALYKSLVAERRPESAEPDAEPRSAARPQKEESSADQGAAPWWAAPSPK